MPKCFKKHLMAKRLVAVAKELNVGTGTIVEYLQTKGFSIDNKPTSKITDEMESELLNKFQKSKAVKEQADSMIIGTRPVARKEEPRISVAPPPPPPPVIPKPTPPPVVEKVVETPPPPVVPIPPAEKVVITPVVEKVPEPPVAKPEAPVVEAKPALSGLTIKGKINLDRKPTSAPKKEEKPTSEPVAKQESITPPLPKVEPQPIVAAQPAPPKVEEKQEAPQPAPVAKQEEEKKPQVQPTEPKKEVSVPTAQKPAISQAKPDVVPTPSVPVPPQEQGIIKAAAPELRGLKILGKIEIEKPKKKRSGRRGDRDNRDNRQGGQRPQGQAGGAVNPSDGVKKEGQNSNDGGDPSRPPRSRIRRRVVQQGQGGQGQGGQRPQGQGQGQGGQRPQGQGQGQGGQRPQGQAGGGPNRGRTTGGRPDNRGTSARPGARRDEVKEVSKKEIEDKIKATMARISGKGKTKRSKFSKDKRERLREKQELMDAESETGTLQVTEFVTVQELANLMDVAVTDVIMACMSLGVPVSINQRLDAEIIELVANEFDHEIEFISAEASADEEEEIIDDPADLEPRAPIVTVMGHVDHGKTSLLDFIRKATVADGEAGGITQHIGAYEVVMGSGEDDDEYKKITFLDTPGHEAFTAMRARGAKVTDVAIIIVAADDSIMPQTKEAISHSQAAGVPMVFAINKIDKPGANPERIKTELAAMNILVEEWGGEYQSQDISAKTGEGIDELLEKVLLVAELLDLKANPDRPAVGAVLEASLDKGRGYVAKTLVQTGTLNIGDPIVAGEHSGKVKAMFNERGQRITSAGPATPVLVLGLSGAPTAGERFKQMESETEARTLASKRARIAREQANRATKRLSLDEIGRRLALGTFKELNLIVKGDFDGSVEALADSLIKLSIETVQVNVIHKAVGQIIESDVLLASASDAIIVGFQVRPSLKARQLAEREGVQVKTYSIIYEAIEEIKLAIEGMLEPTQEEHIIGNIEIREVFKISKVGTIAGCYVVDGKINRNSKIRVIRDGIVEFPKKEGQIGELASLRRVKEDVREVKCGIECGMNIKGFNDIRVGDIIEAYEIVEVKQTLASMKKK